MTTVWGDNYTNTMRVVNPYVDFDIHGPSVTYMFDNFAVYYEYLSAACDKFRCIRAAIEQDVPEFFRIFDVTTMFDYRRRILYSIAVNNAIKVLNTIPTSFWSNIDCEYFKRVAIVNKSNDVLLWFTNPPTVQRWCPVAKCDNTPILDSRTIRISHGDQICSISRSTAMMSNVLHSIIDEIDDILPIPNKYAFLILRHADKGLTKIQPRVYDYPYTIESVLTPDEVDFIISHKAGDLSFGCDFLDMPDFFNHLLLYIGSWYFDTPAIRPTPCGLVTEKYRKLVKDNVITIDECFRIYE